MFIVHNTIYAIIRHTCHKNKQGEILCKQIMLIKTRNVMVEASVEIIMLSV